MSVDIAWDLITSGEDGNALAESIRAFIHAKFQQVALPRFINSVEVHSFEFGSISPEIEIKDIGDPLPDFYEGDEESDAAEDATEVDSATQRGIDGVYSYGYGTHEQSAASGLPARGQAPSQPFGSDTNRAMGTSTAERLKLATTDTVQTLGEHRNAPFVGSSTPGIPGGTSNMSYFHFPVGGLSGAQTPLAAVAGGGLFGTQAWLQDQQMNHARRGADQAAQTTENDSEERTGRARTTGSVSSNDFGSPYHGPTSDRRAFETFGAEKVSDSISSSDILAGQSHTVREQASPSDLQVVARVTYDGDVRMLLTAEIMLDYPMPSFVKIPLKLSITGVSFDGVSILAYIKKRMHFCFLDAEDANTLVGNAFAGDQRDASRADNRTTTIGSLLREIRVETEIGRQESGKQVLKNVGKVERFVLDQVRRIFEDEFVFPSFWTFLV